jgi:hypothetical protein
VDSSAEISGKKHRHKGRLITSYAWGVTVEMTLTQPKLDYNLPIPMFSKVRIPCDFIWP